MTPVVTPPNGTLGVVDNRPPVHGGTSPLSSDVVPGEERFKIPKLSVLTWIVIYCVDFLPIV